MAKVVFTKRGKVLREITLYGFDYNGIQDTDTIQILFKNFIMTERKYFKRFISNKLQRLQFRFSKTQYGEKFHFAAVNHRLVNRITDSPYGSFIVITKYFQKTIEYKIYN